MASTLQANLTQLEASINASKSIDIIEPASESSDNIEETKIDKDNDIVQTVVTPSKWPLKPGVLVHVNDNHTLSPKNQARLQKKQDESVTVDANLGLLERNKTAEEEESKNYIDNKYSKKPDNLKRNSRTFMSGFFKNFRRKSDNDNSDDESGKYKKINKSNKRAVSLVKLNKSGYSIQKSRIRSFFQYDAPNVIITEGGINTLLIILNSKPKI